jgi:hypothetical protein
MPYEKSGKSLRRRLGVRLRIIVAFDNDEVGVQMPVSDLLVSLVLRRVVARQRRRIAGKLDYGMQRSRGAFRNFEPVSTD